MSSPAPKKPRKPGRASGTKRTRKGPAGLASPVAELSGVGPKVAEKLARLTIETIGDLLWHQPLRYEDRGTKQPLSPQHIGESALFEVQINEVRPLFRGKARLVCQAVGEGPHGPTPLTIWFFGRFGPTPQAGRTYLLFGELQQGPNGLEMAQPELVTPSQIGHIRPVYPATEGVAQPKLRQLVEGALEIAVRELSDPLPAAIREARGWPSLMKALQRIHLPKRRDGVPSRLEPAFQRLITEELATHILALRQRRAVTRQVAAPAIPPREHLFDELLGHLGFTPTGAQQRVIGEIKADLAQELPMLRLVQGDVGSGKTLVAAAAALDVIDAGYQVALMAPTALLAEQHARNFAQWFEPLGLSVLLLSGQQSAAQRREGLAQLADGRAQIVIGTHALFQESVDFHRLGLVIVDEQHRFGVHQRLALTDKGASRDGGARRPHQLIMTATPIPRTLAMTQFADLDVSVIDELPPGRTPVTTVVVRADRRGEVIDRISQVCAEGRQAYWVCPLIEEGQIEAQAAESTFAMLGEELPHLSIGMVHGRMNAAEKQREMARFKAGDYHLLVATTVIEVGVDVPNASLMIIENAERMGLAQLHQLRGRVGRGATASHCVLLFDEPLSDRARARLGLMRETEDGFRLAEADLEQRGPGEVLGTRQAGIAKLKIADLQEDQGKLEEAGQLADELLERFPESVNPLIARWVGAAGQYGQV
ncbi:ATP-dependent DNA helicase RecG [Guyparkeria hydrothermalis]|uniref:ATP-dependent DNA helicase RecG n=1 Tax=Guyparkeria hydrothermalis TaxID=923 RepID=UPI00202023EF|nr:ATP-dependent DNA helicase RecG [Guyparkeria hydrothermalis]MCL7744859.1 ATP-dependent DNA helicase RecG [Guyparkeria hydrothermalis]